MHLDPSNVTRFFDGSSSDREAAEVVGHLLKGCPECREKAAEHWPPNQPEASDLEQSLEAVVQTAGHNFAVIAAERKLAERDIRLLLSAPAASQSQMLRVGELERSPELFVQLLESAKDAGFREPAEALRMARLALEVAEAIEVDRYGERLQNDLRARARCHIANAHKVMGDLEESDRQFDLAQLLLDRGTGDVIRQGRLLTLRASLRSVQRRFSETEHLMRRALREYRGIGDPYWTGRTMIDLAVHRAKAGDLEGSIEMTLEGMDLIGEEEWRIQLVGHHSLAATYLDLGKLELAEIHAAKAEELHLREPREVALIRLQWLKGKIAYAKGEDSEAEQAFLTIRDYFLERQIAHEVANVGLDLSLIYLRSGRWQEARDTAAMMLEIYRSKRIQREAIAALALFQKAVTSETATLELVSRLKTFLQEAAADPGTHFEPPGSRG
jgi:tetratricopeptide (TPR) repeat protein